MARLADALLCLGTGRLARDPVYRDDGAGLRSGELAGEVVRLVARQEKGSAKVKQNIATFNDVVNQYLRDQAKSDREKWETMLAQQIEDAGLPTPIWAGSEGGQYKVKAPGRSRPYCVDFYWPLCQPLIVEVLGGEFKPDSKYARGGVALRKWVERLRWLERLGYRVYCFTGQEVKDGTAIQWLREELEAKIGGQDDTIER